MNRASRGSGPGSGGGNLGWCLGKLGLPVRKPVDDLCKGAANLCATCDERWRFPASRAFGSAVTCENTIRALCSGRKLIMSTGHAEITDI